MPRCSKIFRLKLCFVLPRVNQGPMLLRWNKPFIVPILCQKAKRFNLCISRHLYKPDNLLPHPLINNLFIVICNDVLKIFEWVYYCRHQPMMRFWFIKTISMGYTLRIDQIINVFKNYKIYFNFLLFTKLNLYLIFQVLILYFYIILFVLFIISIYRFLSKIYKL